MMPPTIPTIATAHIPPLRPNFLLMNGAAMLPSMMLYERINTAKNYERRRARKGRGEKRRKGRKSVSAKAPKPEGTARLTLQFRDQYRYSALRQKALL